MEKENKNIAKALLVAQQNIGVATKNTTNPYFNSTYADLLQVINAIKKPLNDVGIVFIQTVQYLKLDENSHMEITKNNGDDRFVLDTTLICTVNTILLHESGEYIESVTPVYCKDITNPQALGSGITYSKRYALQAICGLPTADDDGNANIPNPNTSAPKPSIDTSRMLTPEGRNYISTFNSPENAIKEFQKSRTVNQEAQVLITEIWNESKAMVQQ